MTDTTEPAVAGVEAEAIAPVADVNAEAASATTEPTEGNDTDAKQSDETHEEQFPKKAVNAISRRDKQIGKLRAEKYQVLSEVEQLRQQLSQYQQKPNSSTAADPDAPDINQFANYDEYNRAVARYEARKAYAEENQKVQKSQTESQRRAWQEERDTHLDDNAAKVKETFSDFDNILNENVDLLQSFAPHVVDAVRDLDNGAFALYQLAKEGNLEQLNTMSQARAAATLARAEDRALAAAKTKPTTKAPAPLAASKGTAPQRPALLDQLGDDSAKILNWLKSK